MLFVEVYSLEMRLSKRKLLTFEDERLSVQHSLKIPRTAPVNFARAIHARNTQNQPREKSDSRSLSRDLVTISYASYDH